MPRYLMPACQTRVEETILRSRFIATGGPASTVDEAKRFIAAIRGEFPTASHHCYAFLIGPPHSTAQVGISDDGEPSGTAGRPMLAVLQGSGIGDVVVVVTRYFGGTKLGKGGLVRAYSQGAKRMLATLTLREKVSMCSLLVSSPYNWVTSVERLLPAFEADLVERAFTDVAAWRLSVPEEMIPALLGALAELSNGEIQAVL